MIFWQKVGKKVFLTSRFGLVGSVLNSWRFGVRFFEVVTSQTKCRVCQKSQERQVPKSGQIVAKMWAFISPCAFSNAVLQMQAFNAWQSPNILAHKWGGGGGPPLGEFNPPPTEGVQGVLDHNHIAYNQSSRSYHKWPSS